MAKTKERKQDEIKSLKEKLDLMKAIHRTNVDVSWVDDLGSEFSDSKRIIGFVKSQIEQLRNLNFNDNIIASIKLASELVEAIIKYLNSLPRVLVHGDFWDENIVKTSEGFYVLDWENVQVNIPYYDLATLYYSTKFIKNADIQLEQLIERYGLLNQEINKRQ